MATTPRTYLGMADSAEIWRTNEGYKDGASSDGGDPPVYTGGTDYAARATGLKLAPAGADKESIFAALWLVVTHTMAVNVRLTPIVDGVEWDGSGDTSDERITLTLAAKTKRTTEKFLIPLSVPLLIAAIEQGRNAQRGTWFQVRVQTVGSLAEGDLIFEANILEFEPSEATTAVTQ